MKQEQGADDHHHHKFLNQLLAQILHGPHNQIGTIIGGNDLHAFRQTALQLRQLGFDRFDGGQRVFTGAHNNNSADHFPFPIQFRRPAPQFRPQTNISHVIQQNRRTCIAHPQRNPLQVLDLLQVAARTHHVLRFSQFNHRTTDFLIGVLNGHAHLGKGQVVGAQAIGIEHYLILPDHAADRSHISHAIDRLQFVFQKPVLQGT